MIAFIKSLFKREYESNPDLEPCPFCGSDKCWPIEQKYGSSWTGEFRAIIVKCFNCNSQGPYGGFQHSAEAEETWDNRAVRIKVLINNRMSRRGIEAFTCPFCLEDGDAGEVLTIRGRSWGCTGFYVACCTCDATGPECPTQEEAVLEWNGTKSGTNSAPSEH